MSSVQALSGVLHETEPQRTWLEAMNARYGAWRSFRETRNALMNLSDRELDDLGVRRSEISKIARASAYGAR